MWGWTNSPITPNVEIFALAPYAKMEVVLYAKGPAHHIPVLSIIKTNGLFWVESNPIVL